MKELNKGMVVYEGDNTGVPRDWIARICYDDEDTKWFYVFFENPDSIEGFDELYPTLEDAVGSFEFSKMKVAWEKPIESILEEESNNLKQK